MAKPHDTEYPTFRQIDFLIDHKIPWTKIRYMTRHRASIEINRIILADKDQHAKNLQRIAQAPARALAAAIAFRKKHGLD